MPWLQLKLDTNPGAAEHISNLLSELGAVAVTYEDAKDQPVFEPPIGETKLWQHTRIVGLFEADADIEHVKEQLLSQLGQNPPHINIDPLEDKDWTRAWMDSFKPIPCGERLWIVPSWHEPTDTKAVNVILDPGLAFGTGTHPTTALCLKWLDSHMSSNKKQVIDYGCGSGILAVAAALLGAEHVWAVDHDPQALLATKDNAEKNGVADKISTYLPHQMPEMKADLMLANILANPLLELAPKFAALTKANAEIVLSGILLQQAEQISQRYGEWFTMNPANTQEEWVELDGRRQTQQYLV